MSGRDDDVLETCYSPNVSNQTRQKDAIQSVSFESGQNQFVCDIKAENMSKNECARFHVRNIM